MDINSIQGANAYSAVPNTAPPIDNSQLRDQNLEGSRTGLNSDNTAAQQAFEVNITEEAQQRLASENSEETQQAAQLPAEQSDTQNSAQPYETSQIVNIVA
jgi:hypothetical protein